MTDISPSRVLLSLRLAHLKIRIHGRPNCKIVNNWSQTAHKYNTNNIIIIIFNL